jgi:hypothetical protein
MNTDRDALGRWAPGNPGGPGRPPRPTELVYLAALADAVTLDDWRAICAKAKDDALAGDAKARDWLAARLIGAGDGTTLAALALREHLAITPGDELEARAAIMRARAIEHPFAPISDALQYVEAQRTREAQAAEREAQAQADAAERERRRQARAARNQETIERAQAAAPELQRLVREIAQEINGDTNTTPAPQ